MSEHFSVLNQFYAKDKLPCSKAQYITLPLVSLELSPLRYQVYNSILSPPPLLDITIGPSELYQSRRKNPLMYKGYVHGVCLLLTGKDADALNDMRN